MGLAKVGDLTVISGSVSESTSDFVRRTCSLELARTPEARSWLWTPGMTVRVFRAVKAGGQWLRMPVHWGVSMQPRTQAFGNSISLSSPDISSLVSLHRFTSPRTIPTGVTVTQAIQLLVRESIPWVQIEDQTGDVTPCTQVTWQRDRNQAITELAQSIGAEAFFRPDGAFVIRRVRSLIDPAEWVVRQRDNLIEGSEDADLSRSYNEIVVRGDSTAEGSSSVWAISRDEDPSSPTYVGRAPIITGEYVSSLVTSQAQAKSMADSIRFRSQGAQVSISYAGLVHPGVAAGDRREVWMDGKLPRGVCDQIQWDLFGLKASGQARSAHLPAVPEGVQ